MDSSDLPLVLHLPISYLTHSENRKLVKLTTVRWEDSGEFSVLRTVNRVRRVTFAQSLIWNLVSRTFSVHFVVKHLCLNSETRDVLLLIEQIYLIGCPFPPQHFLYISSLKHALHLGHNFSAVHYRHFETSSYAVYLTTPLFLLHTCVAIMHNKFNYWSWSPGIPQNRYPPYFPFISLA